MIEDLINIRSLRLKNGRTLEGQLKHEQKRLLSLIQKHMTKWYASYDPVVYERTFGMRSLYARDYVWIDVNSKKLTMTICFTDAAYGKSLWGNEKINKIQLMNEGYSVKQDVWFKNIPNFGFRDGGHFLEAAIDEFNKANYLGFSVKINY